MPITVCVNGGNDRRIIDDVFAYFEGVDRLFSTYRADSEIEAINEARLRQSEYSAPMREVLALCERTRAETGGYFDIRTGEGRLDPSGIVKGWAVRNASALVAGAGVADYFIDAGGDIQSSGVNESGEPWRVGIRHPFNASQIVKVVFPRGHGIATSGTYVRGEHIYNPHARARPITGIVSLTVIGPDVLEADRFATAAFAMGEVGIHFLDQLPGLEAYVVDGNGLALMTGGFEAFCRP